MNLESVLIFGGITIACSCCAYCFFEAGKIYNENEWTKKGFTPTNQSGVGYAYEKPVSGFQTTYVQHKPFCVTLPPELIKKEQKFIDVRLIVNGKVYDTSEATFIFEVPSGCRYISNPLNTQSLCALYRKQNGEYFFVLRHNPDGDFPKIDTEVNPCSEHYAKSWIESHCNERYEEIFGKCTE